MSKKINYESPHMEIVETRLEGNILTGSDTVFLPSAITGPAKIDNENIIGGEVGAAW
ncbi:MAG: hypothetical protein IK052_02495 [Bacteroidales bacterium]|nr:hypothetical protein [Bacteroidales bacterium]